MIIEHITDQEMEEVVDLANKGWDGCDEAEKKRWAQLVAKARLANAQTGMMSIIDLAKYMTRRDND